jgi:hypothetical protein
MATSTTVTGTLTGVTYDTVVSNDYEMWKSTSNPTRVTCPIEGWYQAQGTVTWEANSTTEYCQLVQVLEVTHPGPVSQNLCYTTSDFSYLDRYLRENLTSIPVYCYEGSYFQVKLNAASSSGLTDYPAIFGLSPDRNNLRVMYLGP